ncbi:helix-turn-helix domain-containing protein [Streptomyces sp. NPDC097704]|uniref:PucR family transcriptional regulator n=1 Tax=Streptomyces sp. NPDC097704 TaxID=3157101 RepID=UPI00333064A8
MASHPPPDPFVRRPWHELPVLLAELIRPRIDGIVAEMGEAIRAEVPAYRRPPDSAVGRDLTAAIRRALWQFTELIENPDGAQDHHTGHFRHLGRIEFLGGRTTDGIQAAFRVGARVGSRRYAEIAQEAELPPQLVVPLHEAVLVHISALSDEAVKGFLAARHRSEGELRRARRALADRLLDPSREGRSGRDPAGGEVAALGPLAERACWPLPAVLACVLVRGAGRLSVPGADDTLLSVTRGGDTVLLIPDPETSGLIERVRAAATGREAAIGPAVVPPAAWLSLQCARLALDHRPPGAGANATRDDAVFVYADEDLARLHLLRGAPIGRLLGRRVLGAFDGLPDGRAERLAATLDALLSSWGRSAPEVARALGIHPQTARQRMRRLEELFGDRLSDPDFRFEALLALRTHTLDARKERGEGRPSRR